jgi:zinc transporter 5/7
MASTYALPVAPHSHGRSPSQSSFFTAPSPSRSARLKALSPVNEHHHSPAAAHRHHKSDMSGQLYGAVRSPYAQYNGGAHTHDHGHDHDHDHDHNHDHNNPNPSHAHTHSHGRSPSNDSTHTTRPFINGKMNGRRAPDLDQARKNASSSGYGFVPPMHEAPHAPPP